MKLFNLISLTTRDDYNNWKCEAEGMLFDNGKVVVRWLSDISSIVIHDNLDNFRKVSVPKGYRKIVWMSKFHYDLSEEEQNENKYLESKNTNLIKHENKYEEVMADIQLMGKIMRNEEINYLTSKKKYFKKMHKRNREEFEELKVDRFSHWQNKIDQINRFRFANNRPKIEDEDLLNYLEKQFKPAYLDF